MLLKNCSLSEGRMGSLDFLIDEIFDHGTTEELKIIFKLRLDYNLQEFYRYEDIWRSLGVPEIADPMRIEQYVAESTYDQLTNELYEYKKKFKEEINSTIEKARKENLFAILRLVAWDKTWICMDFVCSLIIKAQATGDKKIINELATALKNKSPYVIKEKTQSQNELPLALIKVFTYLAGVCGRNITHAELKKIHSGIDKHALFDTSEEVSPFSDFTYFKKFLKRHKLQIK
jgi:hypothetical protein